MNVTLTGSLAYLGIFNFIRFAHVSRDTTASDRTVYLYATRLCQHRIFIDTYTQDQETFYVTQLERRHTLSRCRNVSGGARCLTRVRWH